MISASSQGWYIHVSITSCSKSSECAILRVSCRYLIILTLFEFTYKMCKTYLPFHITTSWTCSQRLRCRSIWEFLFERSESSHFEGVLPAPHRLAPFEISNLFFKKSWSFHGYMTWTAYQHWYWRYPQFTLQNVWDDQFWGVLRAP